jgi:hypothetical protein
MAFITKDDQQRIDETLNFIANTTLVNVNMRNAVSTFVSDFVRRKLPTGSSRQELRTFSRGMSMAKVSHAGSEGQRAMRRALHLIWEAIGNHQRAESSKLTPGLDIQYDFKRSMEKAWIASEQTLGGTVAHQWVFDNGLKLHTKAFLKRNIVKIDGSTKIDGTQGDRNVLDFWFAFDKASDRYVIGPSAIWGGVKMPVVSVPAVHWADIPGRAPTEDRGTFAGMVGTEVAGASLMVTTQFTGCSFCIKDVGRVFASHISPSVKGRPHPFSDGTKLAKQLAGDRTSAVTGGDFSNAIPGTGKLLVFGRGYSNLTGLPNGYDARCAGGGNCMYILGFLRNTGQWKFFSQEVIGGRINDAKRIFPERG